MLEAIEKIKNAISPFRPEAPVNGPVYIKIIWCFPYRKSERKAKLGEVIPKDTRPDIDNLNKNLLDILQKEQFITDDSNVVRLTTEKCWYETSGLYIKIMEIDPEIFGEKIEKCIQRCGIAPQT